ncbi:tetratricopeptide (TPR) repeat protein [Kitasatospora sp. MAA19]|uniref:hypothetical protein n=1 Tax=Kitasatospora sp. MAA19 TaxID=3035090 RepID=UPI0024758570|nr:hypothetical protein [Kitasatospora sp. MAA19]MDH6709279.1 tetratricopeptide (TPR) repeat protein [Kitasatospora sp. MAA19]
MELDRLFDGRRRSAIEVADVFVDRRPLIRAFDQAVADLRQHAAPTATAPAQRRNLLVFHGLGGIGKTRLSKHLEQRLRNGEYDQPAERRIGCRIDFEDPAFAELENLVIALRAAVGQRERNWPAFDLAFAVYWQRAHPGEPLGQVISRDSALRRLNGVADLPQQIDETLNALLGPIPIAGLARRAVTALISRIRDRIRRDRLLATCPGLEAITEIEDPAEQLPFLPALLSWDLAEHSHRHPLDVVFFLDTLEKTERRPRLGGGFEDRLARLVYLLPNVLFVATGRNRLDWGDRHHPAIHYSGPNYWPTLAVTLPQQRQGDLQVAGYHGAQHQLTGLSPIDADTYLRLRLTRRGEPAIPLDIREAVIVASGGAPLYLELSAEYFDQLSADGRTPQPADFGGTFAEMFIRIMRDLDREERALLRAASLVHGFDADLLNAAVPDARDSALRRFLARPIVQQRSTGWLRHSVDEYVREAVRAHDQDTDDAWSTAEWRRAAERMVGHLGGQLAETAADPTTADRARLAEGFTTAGLLTAETGEVPDWLYDLAYGLRLRFGTQVLADTADWPVPADGPTAAFALACQGIAQRNLGSRAIAVELLERAAAHPALAGGGYPGLFVRHRLGKALEEAGRYAEAERLIAQAAEVESPLRSTAEKDLAWVQWLRGDGRRLVDWSRAHLDSAIGFHRAQALDLLGQFSYLQGEFADAERYLRAEVDDPELAAAGIGRDGGWRHLGMVLSWIRPLEAIAVLDRALEVNQEMRAAVGVAQTYLFRGVARTGYGTAAEVRTHLAEGERRLADTNGGADRWMVLLALLFHELVDGTRQGALAAGDRLIAYVRETDCHPGLGEIAERWLAVRGLHPAEPVLRQEHWTERDRALAGWEQVLRERLALRTPSR